MSGLKFDMSSLFNGLSELENKANKVSKLYAESAGTKMVNYAKENAKWTDRTGNSRQTIDKTIEVKGNSTEIKISGNTSHFKYLELAHEKKHAILWPTIQKHATQVLRGWAKVIWK